MNKRSKKECESGIDYILPDYMGDIRKILMSRAKVVPSGSFATEGVLEASGSVEYEVLYTDSDGKLTAINTSSDYTARIPIKDGEYEAAALDPTVASLAVRVTGPRKVSLRAIVETDALINYSNDEYVMGDAAESKSAECEYVNVTAEKYVFSGSLEREYAEEGDRLVGVVGEDVDIISVGGEVVIREAIPKAGGAEVRGDLLIYAIVRAPMQPPFRIKRSIPFSEFIAMDGDVEGAVLIPRGTVSSAVVGANDDGEDKQLVFSAIAELSCVAILNEKRSLVSDLYLPDYETENTYKNREYTSLESYREIPLDITATVSRESVGAENITELIHTSCDVSEIETELDGENVRISATAHLCGVACEVNADGSVDYIPIKTSTKIEHNVNNCFYDSENVKAVCRIRAHSADSVVDASEITLSAVCDVELSLLSGKSVRCLASSAVGEKIKPTGVEVTVYFPTPGDTLYSVGKHFHTPIAKIVNDNDLSLSAGVTSFEEIDAKKIFIIR